jgi:hypothetical protein
MQLICAAKGFATTQLKTALATRDGVTNAIRQEAAQLQAGDLLVLSYSGHGGQIPDHSGDEEDYLDETWCLYDGQLLDDELDTLWTEFRAGVRIAVFSDSCHSGTVIKAMLTSSRLPQSMPFLGGTVADWQSSRAMPIDVMRTTYIANKANYDDIAAANATKAVVQASVILVSGCQDNQLSMDGPFNGAFTSALLGVYANGGFGGSYYSLAQQVRAKLPMTQSPNYMELGVHDPAFSGGPCFSY